MRKTTEKNGGEWGTPRENEVVDLAGHGNSSEK